MLADKSKGNPCDKAIALACGITKDSIVGRVEARLASKVTIVHITKVDKIVRIEL